VEFLNLDSAVSSILSGDDEIEVVEGREIRSSP
jgi:hypothetical protein